MRTRAQKHTHTLVGRGDDTVGDPHRSKMSQFELFELILLLKLDNQFSVEQFEPTVSQSTVPSPLLTRGSRTEPRNPASGRLPYAQSLY